MSPALSAGRAALFIAIAGPAIGGLLYALPLVATILVNSPAGDGLPSAVETLRIVGLIFGFSYLFGGLQALICAIVLGAMVYRDGTFSNLAAQMTVIGTHMLIGLLWILSNGPEVVGTVVFFTVLSMASAWIVRRLLDVFGWLHPSGRPAATAA